MTRRTIILCVLMAALTGCSHRTLMAPCDGNVGPLQLGDTITPTADSTAVPPSASSGHDCGPLKPVNLTPVIE